MTDLDAIRNTWLTNCGHCDFGMVINCTCPSGDPRNIIAQLADELEQQATELAQLRAIAEAATAFVDTYDHAAAGTWPTHRTLNQTITDHTTYTNARNTLTHTIHTWRRHQLRPPGDGWTPGTLQDTTGRTLDWTRTPDTPQPTNTGCATCTGHICETVGMVCQTCGTDYRLPLILVAPNGCDDCTAEPGEHHRHPGCPGNHRAITRQTREASQQAHEAAHEAFRRDLANLRARPGGFTWPNPTAE